ncbi:MAG: TetR/AcrR family transcriptional regulator [Anaerolineae bacterium]|nr:TetR/AcrR family transcriptional regulator [Anaerolineae bacterium]
MPDNETYQRILDAAAELFARHGYEAVTLRDIGQALDMKHASLYYYAPEGKKQLYLDVMERNLMRHRAGIAAAIAGASDDLRAQLRAVGRWLISQPPVDMRRLIRVDTKGIGAAEAAHLSQLANAALREPLVAALGHAREAGLITLRNLDMGAVAFITMIEVVHGVQASGNKMPMDAYIDELIDMLMNGWLGR